MTRREFLERRKKRLTKERDKALVGLLISVTMLMLTFKYFF